jgi:hypothetical protein
MRTTPAAAPYLSRRRPWAESEETASRSTSPRWGRAPPPPRHREPERSKPPPWDCTARPTNRPHAPAGTPRATPATSQLRRNRPYHADANPGAPPQRNRRGTASQGENISWRARPTPLPRRQPRRPRRPSADREGTPSPPPPAGRREAAPPAPAAPQAPSRPGLTASPAESPRSREQSDAFRETMIYPSEICLFTHHKKCSLLRKTYLRS